MFRRYATEANKQIIKKALKESAQSSPESSPQSNSFWKGLVLGGSAMYIYQSIYNQSPLESKNRNLEHQLESAQSSINYHAKDAERLSNQVSVLSQAVQKLETENKQLVEEQEQIQSVILKK